MQTHAYQHGERVYQYQYRKSIPIWIYFLIVVALIGCFVPALKSYNHENKQVEIEKMRGISLLTIAELEHERLVVLEAVLAPPSDDLYQYFVVLSKITRYKELQEKFLVSVPWNTPLISPATNVQVTSQWYNQILKKYLPAVQSRSNDFVAAREKYSTEHGGLPLDIEHRSSVSTNHSISARLFALGFLWSILVANIFIMVRVHDKGGKILWQLHKILPYSVVWFWKIWTYPTEIVRYEDVKQAMRIVKYALMGFLSIGSYGGLAKAAEFTKSKMGKDTDSLVTESPFEIHGFLQNRFSEGVGQSYDITVNAARVNGTYHFSKGLFGFAEVELVNAGATGSNWLRNLELSYTNGDYSVNAGRILSVAAYSLPAPFTLSTVHYPWSPFTGYGWGVKATKVITPSLSFTSDFTLGTGLAFDNPKSFRSKVLSGRLSWSGERGQISPTFQVGEDFIRYGADGNLQVSDTLTVKEAVFVSQQKSDRFVGGYVLANWLFKRPWSVHAQVDRAPKGVTITTGFGWRVGMKGWSITIDREDDTSTDKSAYFGRLQFQF